MPAIRRRRGSAESFGRDSGDAGLPFCSGGNLSTGSAIALFLSRRLIRRMLDRVANVLLDQVELVEKAVGVGGVDAVERGRRQFGAKPGELAEQGTRGFAQIKAVDAAVVLVAAAFDPAIVAELVDQPRQRDRLHLHLFGEGPAAGTPPPEGKAAQHA